MKTKTAWYLLLGMIIYSAAVMNGLYLYIGMLLFGISCYAAGAFHIKWRLEKDTNEYDKLIGGKNEKTN